MQDPAESTPTKHKRMHASVNFRAEEGKEMQFVSLQGHFDAPRAKEPKKVLTRVGNQVGFQLHRVA